MKIIKAAILALSIAASITGCVTAGGKGASLSPAPSFSVKLITGEQVSLDSLRAGRPMVLNVGATWCSHCQHELPTFKKVHDRYKDKVAILMVFEKSPLEDAQTLAVKNDLKFPIATDPDGDVAKAYGVKGMPVTFFIDREGRLVDDYFGAIEDDELSGKIDDLLK